ncbi:MAG: aspartate carbamoyltransferase catalytic subunit [Bergeyella sp.]|nr:aspartate carbamoyltransferase catalytic subunit [Bergeyella sp.]
MFTAAEVDVRTIWKLLEEAMKIAEGKFMKPKNEIFVANLFYENSTRTKTSFDIAERRLGLTVIPFDVQNSSASKGESLYDTAKTLKSLGLDLLVIRHSQDAYYRELSRIGIPIINAGDGKGHHPSQCMLDLLTIYQEFGNFQDLKVGIVGDVKHSRVANSDAEALRKLGAKVYFSGPPKWFDMGTIINGTFVSFEELVREVDVLILLRIQHERHDTQMQMSTDVYHRKYGLTLELEKHMKREAIIMHPAPINRGVEIADELVESSKSRIFKQMENGVYVRMAILKHVLEKNGHLFEQILG